MIPHDILAASLKGCGFDGWTVRRRENWLEGHVQRVLVNSSVSECKDKGCPSGVCAGTNATEYLHQGQWD